MSTPILLSVAARLYDDSQIKPSATSPDTIFIGSLGEPGAIQLTFDTPEAAERLAAHAHQRATQMRIAEMEAIR